MSDIAISSPAPASRFWLRLAVTGLVLVILAMIVVALVLFDKPHFGWLVGTWFLWLISGGVMFGALLVGISAFNLPGRFTWRGITLMVWALIAITSPGFGYLFLLPWTILLVMLPVVTWIIRAKFRDAV